MKLPEQLLQIEPPLEYKKYQNPALNELVEKSVMDMTSLVQESIRQDRRNLMAVIKMIRGQNGLTDSEILDHLEKEFS